MDWIALSIVVACLFVSGFFAASETALTGASRASMLRLSKQGNRDAGVVSSLFAMRERMIGARSEEHTSELQSRRDLVCRLLLEKKK